MLMQLIPSGYKKKLLAFPLPALEIEIKQCVSLRAEGHTDRSVSHN